MISPSALHRRRNLVGIIPLKFQEEMSAVGFISHRSIQGIVCRLEH